MTLGTITSDLSDQLSLKNGASSATATISASDPITVSISGPATVDEGDATSAYTVSLSPSGVTPSADLTVSYGTADGTATVVGKDYTAKSGTLTFRESAAGSQTFTVQTTDDTVDESDETFTVTISSPSGGGGTTSLGTAQSVTTTITDDDDAPTGITLSANPNTLGEDDAATSVTVTATLNGSTLPSNIVVTIGTLAGSATKGTDYTATSLASITIPANTASGTGTLTITPTDDSVVEGDETIEIPGTTTTQVGLTVSSSTVTLTDDNKTTPTPDDDKDTATLSIAEPTSNVAEGSDASFTVTLSAAVSEQVQVAWSAPLGTDAAESADLGATSGTVTFAANSAAGATQSITIGVEDDALSEAAEGFTVTLGAITSDISSQLSLKSGASSATASISASDPITISISGPSSVDEGDATTAYTVSLSPSGVTPTADLTVSYGTADGTAEAGKDYTAKSGTLTFTQTDAGSQTFTVRTTDDSVDEGTGETFTVSISSPAGGGGATSLGTTKSVTTTITDDDAAPTGITLSASPSSLGEDDGKTDITVTATLDGDSTRTEATVVTIGTLAGSATKDTDYAVNTALTSITIAANSESGTGTLTITPTDDSIVEGNETITIPGSTTTQVGLSVTSATVTLKDHNGTTTEDPDDEDAATLSIAGPAANVSEGSDATFTVTLSASVSKQVQVAWSAPLGTDAAVAADLSATSGTVTFAAGSAAGSTQDITITATDDALSETAEGFTVTLGDITSDVSGQLSLKSGASSATASISASDPITVSISGPSSVDEGDTTTAYTVSLSPAGVKPSEDLTVDYGTADGTATVAGKDYTAKSGTLTFTSAAAGSQTFTVQTKEDTTDESDETFTVSISSPAGGGGQTPTLGTAAVTTTITDDDDAPTGITLSADPDTLGEDDAATSITVTATLGGSTLPSDTVVTIGALSGSATKDTDYAVNTALASITIAANSESGTGTLTITPTDDSIVEGNETITIPGSTTTQVGLTVTSATVTLTDHNGTTTDDPDDEDAGTLSISGPASNVAEGGNAVFTVTLSAVVSKEVQVAWSAPLGTDAAESSDLSVTSGTVTFAAGSAAGSTQDITITATDDALSETAESFTVTLGTITSDLSDQLSLKSGASSATASISASDPITVSLSGPATVDEGDATTDYTVSLSPAGVTPTADLTVSYATANGTATAGSDYTAKSGTLTFTNAAAGSQTFTVQTTGDTVDEGTGETFTVSISSPAGGGGPAPSLGTAKSVTTTITDDDDAPTGITLSASPNSLGEDDAQTSITVTATLGGSTLPSDTVVTIGTLAGSATAGTDYAVNTALTSITIPANSTSHTGTLTITPTDDSIVEGDEEITIPGSTTVSGLSVSSATVTLTDDNKTTTTPTDDKDKSELSISGPAANVSEGSDATFTVTLSAAVSKQVQVAWSAPLGTDAAESADLGTTSGTVTFAANSAAGATQSITITATDDMLSEATESFTVTLGTITSDLSDQVSLKSGASSATGSISASDPITISISGPSAVDEGDTTTAYTVSLSPSGVKPSEDLTVSYGTANGTATAGSDYTAKSGTLTFTSAAAGSQTFTVQTTDDTVDEGTGETFTVSISSPAGGGGPAPNLGTAKSVTTTISDDDDAPTGITLSASPNTLGEDDGQTSITVTATLNGSTLPTNTVVTIGTLAGSATKDTDYSATSLASITIDANETSGTGTLTITPTDDSIVEGDETITIPGTTTTQVGLSVTSATVTLKDHNGTTTDDPDDEDKSELSISGPSSSVAEGSDATFTVTLSAAVAKEVRVAWTATGNTDDYSPTSGTVTFAANSAAGATQSITIMAADDALSETAEGFTVTLGAITSDVSSQLTLKSGASSATASISASDPITISISGPSSVDEGDTTTAYTVSLSPSDVKPSEDLTVSYTTADGTATAGSDYTAKSDTLTFTQAAAGSQTFTVQTTDDTVDEGTGETFSVSISSPAGGGGPAPSLGTNKSVTTTISDDDDAPTGITLSASPNTLGEDDGETDITVTATLNGSARASATVVTIGALAGTATKGTDYAVNTALTSVTIPANETSGTGTLTITPTDDSVVEGAEEITIPGSTTVSGLSVSSATVTLTDDNKTTPTPTDDKDKAELSISGPAANVAEGSDATFTVTLSASVSKQVQVAWSAPLGTDAAESSDLSATSGTVTFAAGSTAGATQSITIMAADDALSETVESFTITLGTITSDLSDQLSLKSNASSATATISASDPITVSISGPSSVDEGDTTTTYTVSLSPSGVKPSADLTVSYATTDGTATAGSDYTAASGTLTFSESAAGSQTFTVQTTDDSVDEGTGETFTVSISSPAGGGGATSLGTAKSVTTTITDDDDAPTGITLSASPSSLGEDDGKTDITVTATLDGGSTRTSATVVTIGTLAGTATKDTDYAVSTALASITIAANSASGTRTLAITPTDDSIVEGDETIKIPGTTTTQVGLTVSPATVTLTDDNKTTPTPDDDKDSAELSISGPSGAVSEGSDATFTVTLSKAVAAEVQVAWTAPLGTDAAEASDLGATSGTVTFAANSAAGATQTITITATDDALSEEAESFTVTLGAITTTLPSSQLTVKSDESSATATIAESDPITIELSGPDTVEEGDTATYTVSLSPEGVTPTTDLTVSYATADGTAKSGSDYTAKSDTLTFTNTAAGSQTVDVQTIEGIVAENSETFTFSISNPAGGGGQTPTLGTSEITTTINDDDGIILSPTNPPSEDIDIKLSVAPNSVNEDAGATNFTVTATNTGTILTEAMTIALALGGTADSGDYTAPTKASVTIPANQSSGTGTLTLTLIDDNEVEGDETIIVGGSFEDLTIGSALITVHDNEATYLTISGPASEVREGSAASFTVTLSKDVDAAVTVAWTATAGTAEASDYGTASGSVTFAADSGAGATQTITVATIEDDLSETAETFSVELGADSGNRADIVWVKTTASGATATIAASDPITVEFSGPDTVEEGDVATYTVSLSPEGVIPTADLTVDYATADGTATAGEDYTAASGTLTFTQADHGDKTVDVQTTEDILSESDEDFKFSISNPSGGGGDTPTLISSSSNTNITDDDVIGNPNEQGTAINIQLSVAPDNVNENAGPTNFTVTATNTGTTRTEDMTIALALGGTADSSDYTAPPQASVTIPANQSSGTATLTLTMKDDDDIEGDETIIVGGSFEALTIGSALITVHDDEATYLSISGPASEVTEGNDASFTVTLSKDVDADRHSGVGRNGRDG